MSRFIKWVAVAVAIVGILFLLESRVSEQPMTPQVKAVSADVLQK